MIENVMSAFFHEERDIGREIKNLDVSAEQQATELSKFLFDGILVDAAKHRYAVNKKDFGFNRIADSRAFQGIISNELNLEVITPLNFDFDNEALISTMKDDKKNQYGKTSFALIRSIGEAVINQTPDESLIRKALDFSREQMMVVSS